VSALYALQTVGLIEASKDGRAVTYKWIGGTAAPKARARRAAKQATDNGAA
jgi:hypothetical protein